MIKLHRFFALAAAVVALAPMGGAHASVMLEVKIPQLARDADVVARGKVKAMESRRSGDGRRIYTLVTVEVAESWKGTPGETVQIQVPGGAVDGIAQIVQGAPSFSEGEDVVVFLEGATERAEVAPVPLRVVAMAQGKLSVKRDASGVEMALQDLSGLELLEKGAPAPVPAPAAQPVRVVDLERQVKAAAP